MVMWWRRQTMTPREWLRLLLDHTGTCGDVRDALAVAEEGGRPGVVAEFEMGVLVEGLRLAADAPDLYFVDARGPFHPSYSDMPGRLLDEIGADELFPPGEYAALRDEINTDGRQRRAAEEAVSDGD